MASTDNALNITDYQFSEKYSLQPFYKAGDCVPVKWIHRNEGKQYSAALVLSDLDTLDDEGSSESFIVLGGGSSGIAGTTFYQVQAQIIEIPSSALGNQ